MRGRLTPGQFHYLTKVMRTDKFLAFNGGIEFEAGVMPNAEFQIFNQTSRKDPSGSWTFCFAPIKRIEDLISGVVQMGAGVLLPVITERTVARHVNWDRMRKIIIESSEQSGRCSLPEMRAPISFAELDKRRIIYGDERKCGPRNARAPLPAADDSVFLIGPEGGFSESEFSALDAAGAIGVSLGKTILRAETAAIALCATRALRL
jgi:16S rRNA (uracil1498-N3)-methyltransferase